jgi:ATP adenylyltransferase
MTDEDWADDDREVVVQVDDADAFAGEPDGLQRLWTPHRMAYIGGQGLVVARSAAAYVVLNLYPYNSGHLLVCPYRHVPDYTDLTPDEVADIAGLTQTAMRVLREVLAPQGFNLGMNQGDVAGAGIAAHLHQHVVPRWVGDSNFLPIVARTRALPALLADTRARLAAAWPTDSKG